MGHSIMRRAASQRSRRLSPRLCTESILSASSRGMLRSSRNFVRPRDQELIAAMVHDADAEFLRYLTWNAGGAGAISSHSKLSVDQVTGAASSRTAKGWAGQ